MITLNLCSSLIHVFMLQWCSRCIPFIYLISFFICVIQSRAACTPPRRKPLESDFETIKLISNGAYGWVRQSLGLPDSVTLWTSKCPYNKEEKKKCRICCGNFSSYTSLNSFIRNSWLEFISEWWSRSLIFSVGSLDSFSLPLSYLYLLSSAHLSCNLCYFLFYNAELCIWCATRKHINVLPWRRSTGKTWFLGTKSSRFL